MLNSILYSLLNIYVHVKLFLEHSVTKLYREYPIIVQIYKTIRYNMYSGYKWWYSIRSEPLNEKNWIHLSSIILYDQNLPNSSESVVKRLLGTEAPCQGLWTSVPNKMKRPWLYYCELYRTPDDFDENIHLVQYWNNHLKNHNNVPHVINCPLLMVKHNDKYLIHLYTNPCKKNAYLSDITQLINFDSQEVSVTNSSGLCSNEATLPNSSGDLRSPSELVVQRLSAPLPNSSGDLRSPSELVVQRLSAPLPNSSGDLRSPSELVVQRLSAPLPNSSCHLIPSKVRFLNVSYTNPNMSNEILLEIPYNMFFVGNHLLSAVFVLRMLEYTVGSNVTFDTNYKLKIMDSNIQYFEMDSNEYLELELDTYKLQRVA
uniref:Uncharacterized protein n=1 Tax=viral metagenome TaxID=1070528 RepID=A0A6C0ICR3_9ZZZZ